MCRRDVDNFRNIIFMSFLFILNGCTFLPFMKIDRAELLRNVNVLCIASDYQYSSYSYQDTKKRGWDEALSASQISAEAQKILESSQKTLAPGALREDDLDTFTKNYPAYPSGFSYLPERKECDATLFIYCQGGARCGRYFVEGLGAGVEHCPVAEMEIVTLLTVNGKVAAEKRVENTFVVPPGFAFEIAASEVVEQPPFQEAFEASEFQDLMRAYSDMLRGDKPPPAE